MEAQPGGIVRPIISDRSNNNGINVKELSQSANIVRPIQSDSVLHQRLVDNIDRDHLEAGDRLQLEIIGPCEFKSADGRFLAVIEKRHNGNPREFRKRVVDGLLYIPPGKSRAARWQEASRKQQSPEEQPLKWPNEKPAALLVGFRCRVNRVF
jgi:hypothetical protein